MNIVSPFESASIALLEKANPEIFKHYLCMLIICMTSFHEITPLLLIIVIIVIIIVIIFIIVIIRNI